VGGNGHRLNIWFVIASDQVGQITAAWLQYAYSSHKLFRLQPELLDAIDNLGVEGLRKCLNNEETARDALDLVRLSRTYQWGKFPQRYNSPCNVQRTSWLVGPNGPRRWKVSYLPYDAWRREIHPRGFPSRGDCGGEDGVDARDWPGNAGNARIPDPTALSPRASWPDFSPASIFRQDGTLKEGRRIAGVPDWWGSIDDPQTTECPYDDGIHQGLVGKGPPPAGGGGNGPPGGDDDAEDSDDDGNNDPPPGGSQAAAQGTPSDSTNAAPAQPAALPENTNEAALPTPSGAAEGQDLAGSHVEMLLAAKERKDARKRPTSRKRPTRNTRR